MSGSPSDSLPEDLGSSQSEQPPRVLYPYRELDADIIFEVALAIAEAHEATLLIVDVDTDDGVRTGPDDDLVAKLLDIRVERDIDVAVERRTLTGETTIEAVTTALEAFALDAVVVSEGQDLTQHLRKQTDCALVTVESKQMRSVASILAPIAGGPHTGGIVDVAGALAAASDAWVEFLHIRTGDEFPDERGAELLEEAKARLPDVETDGRVLDEDDVTETIVAQSDYHDVTVIGAPRRGRFGQLLFGSTTTDVRGRANNTVVTVRHGDAERTLFSEYPD